MSRNNRSRPSRIMVTLLTCILAVPTVAVMMNALAWPPTKESVMPYLQVGLLLGAAHLLLRPLLRLITAPLGCLTLGLSGFVIDVGLLYLCAKMIPAFVLPGLLYAVLTACLINTFCALFGRR